MTTKFYIARDFSRYPGGRFEQDGPFSGETFRSSVLVPAMNAGETIEIYLDGVRGYGSSFLEEAFGGLVRLGFAPDFVLSHLKLFSENPSLRIEVEEYIRDAAGHAQPH